ncbi:TPA: hypothetical protein DEP96_02735 [Candidatus Uhrbacteria bacterium]|nr:hypothetical protein [Candidatus Uhrbacteria bacterium]
MKTLKRNLHGTFVESQHSTARDVFGHLLAIGTLYACFGSFIALLFQYINVKFPDALSYSYVGSLDAIRTSMAILIVVWPVFIFISWLLAKDVKANPAKHNIGIKKWLLYLTLFATAITMIVDLVTLVNYFLNGEITTRFILKVIIVLLTSASVFGYYLWDLRRDATVPTKLPMIAAIKDSIIIAAVIILGFVLVGSPAQQRAVRFDETRVNDLSVIQNEVVNYYVTKHVLPVSLADLSNTLYGFAAPVDPESGEAYSYDVIIDTMISGATPDESISKFKVCANFATDNNITPTYTSTSAKTTAPVPARDMYGNSPYSNNWSHTAGTVCFERQVDSSMFISNPPIVK